MSAVRRFGIVFATLGLEPDRKWERTTANLRKRVRLGLASEPPRDIGRSVPRVKVAPVPRWNEPAPSR